MPAYIVHWGLMIEESNFSDVPSPSQDIKRSNEKVKLKLMFSISTVSNLVALRINLQYEQLGLAYLMYAVLVVRASAASHRTHATSPYISPYITGLATTVIF